MVRVSLAAPIPVLISPGSFVARLLGKTLNVRKSFPREVEVSFKAPRVDSFRATLSITFSDKIQSNELPGASQFTVTRELRGRAILPGPASSQEPPNKIDGDGMESDRAGVTVSDASGVECSVERSRLDGSFDKLTTVLVITKSSRIPLVSFKEARVSSADKSVARLVYITFRQLESHILGT
jgi:hypothetical protein